ncbi:MFS family permease [Paenibacillus forsythiae]|uniref:MFS family permease n=1 Tax=Paenibacillus forsythiae TaxID=365616 RepID=A0ABU3H2R2_9BACL|nr:MFS transporter [Paenibacillus forsythiae]MDT3424986.1 MFS family permease [Paenibacillus forsythiae]
MERQPGKLHELFGGGKGIIYSIALLVGASMGVINPLSTTHMTASHGDEIWIGVISSSYFLFMALGSVFADRTMRGSHVKRVITSGLLLTAICASLFPLFTLNGVWLGLMSLMGIGISCNMVGMQTALHNLSNANSLGTINGIYSLCFALGLIVSAALAPQVYSEFTWLPFVFSSLCLMLAAGVIHFKLTGLLVLPERAREKIISKITLPLFGAFVYGFSETIVVSLYPLYLIREHVAVSRTGYALSIFVVGSIIGLLPLTCLADRMGRRKCLAVCVFLSMLAVTGIVAASDISLKMLYSFAAGFMIGPLYPLSMALAVQDLPGSERSSGNAWFTTFYGFGSAAGPFFSSVVMDIWGHRHIFTASLLLFCLFLTHMLVTRKGSKVRLTKEEML